MGSQVLFHILLRIQRRRESRVGRRGNRTDGDIRRVRRGKRVHSLGRAPVPRDAHSHQLFPAQPHRGRLDVRRHHARPGLRARPARLAIRRLHVPAFTLLTGTIFPTTKKVNVSMYFSIRIGKVNDKIN